MPYRRRPATIALGISAANLVVPGSGYAIIGDWRRALALFVILNGIFAIGLAFDGVILAPAFNPRDPLFNIVALLTFLVQAFHAGGTSLLLWLQGAPERPLGGLLLRDPAAVYSDLGSFHLLVAGALNYFCSIKLYDSLTERRESPNLDLVDGEEKT